MILELLILIFLLWIWSGGFIAEQQRKIPSDQEIILNLNRDINSLFDSSDEIPRYRLIPNSKQTFVTNKENIYLVLRDSNTGNLFDYHTLFHVTIHEMAHIICPDTSHSITFYSIESSLEERAIERNLLPPYHQVDSNYPCQYE